MYQQIPLQNQNLVYQNIVIPTVQNPNQLLLVNNQLLYQNQLAHQQVLKLNQPKIQLINPQPPSNIQNVYVIPKTQNIQNPQIVHRTLIPQNTNWQQIIIGQNGGKAYANAQIQRDINVPLIQKNPVMTQNIPYQTNSNKNKSLKPQTSSGKKVLASSHLDLITQNPSLEPIKQTLPVHLQIEQQYSKIPGYSNKLQIPKMQMTVQPQAQPYNKKSATLMTVNSLAKIPYNEYPQVEFSIKHFYNISGFAANSYNGKSKNYNEDKYKAIPAREIPNIINGEHSKSYVSYFGIFDGHGGDKCSIFLKNKMDDLLLNSKSLLSNPIESIRDAFVNAENQFFQQAVVNGKMVDRSGSCAVISLIIDNILYSINLGDSRALYSRDGGKELFQITRDHKPNDEIEKKRIEKYGGKVYYANKAMVNGIEVTLKEEQFGKGFKFPYRLAPSGLAVSLFFFKFF